MVRLSLIVKFYLYSLLVLLLSIPLALTAGERIRSEGRQEFVRVYLVPQLGFLEQEVERSLKAGVPAESRLVELGRGLHHHLRFVPWAQAAGYPPELRSQNVLADLDPNNKVPHHWIRIDHAGKPIGALEAVPLRMGPPPPGPLAPRFALTWVFLLVLVVVPPILLWVRRPLRAMVRVAARLGGGDLETPVRQSRRDEFGELERAFERMRVDLRAALKQRERLLTDVSHEIRGPLTRMTLALPLLQMQGASGPVLEIMERELKAADDLLGDVLDLARGRSHAALSRDPLDLSAIARHCLEERAIVGDRKRLHLEWRLEPAMVRGDRRQIERAIGNLIDNALKYTPEGGHVLVSTGTDGDQGVFRVVDDGPGVAAEHQPFLFEPFYRPDVSRSRETGGTGLGLAIVRDVAESHGGLVRFDSTPGQGAQVELRLPLGESRAMPGMQVPGEA